MKTLILFCVALMGCLTHEEPSTPPLCEDIGCLAAFCQAAKDGVSMCACTPPGEDVPQACIMPVSTPD